MFDLDQLLKKDTRRIIILDDDPTGSQTSSDVEVILEPTDEALAPFFSSDRRAVYVLTNTRALPEKEAVQYTNEITQRCKTLARKFGQEICFIQRGDSTLRGHVFAELDALDMPDSVILFVPAFPEGGRVTMNGVHYIKQAEQLVPVSSTEFAKDPVYGYQSHTLIDWTDEVGKRRAITIPLQDLRKEGPLLVMQRLLDQPGGTVVIPDAETVEDIRTIVTGLLLAEEKGANVKLRSAATFASVRAGLYPKRLKAGDDQRVQRLLVVCGSHTDLANQQLTRFEQEVGPSIILRTEDALAGTDQVVEKYRSICQDAIQNQGIVTLATERIRKKEHHNLATADQIMRTLIAIVQSLTDECDAVIAKGGITSAEVARVGIGAKQAYVCGQVEPGVSLWKLTSGEREIPYIVVPGNIGDEQTLLRSFNFFKRPSHFGKEIT